MKNKLAALLCAAMLACALPALAWAEEAAEPTADQATAQEPEAAQETGAATRSIGPWQESASNEDGSCVLSGETRASSLAVIATSETADDALDGMPSFRVVAQNATKKIDFGVAFLAGGAYAGCNKLEVHVKPSANSAGVAKTFEVTRAVNQSSFNFTSEAFNLGDQTGDASYNADFVMTLVPSKVDADEPAADEPAADAPAALPSGADTGATSPKTGMDAGALTGASFGMLAAAARQQRQSADPDLRPQNTPQSLERVLRAKIAPADGRMRGNMQGFLNFCIKGVTYRGQTAYTANSPLKAVQRDRQGNTPSVHFNKNASESKPLSVAEAFFMPSRGRRQLGGDANARPSRWCAEPGGYAGPSVRTRR